MFQPGFKYSKAEVLSRAPSQSLQSNQLSLGILYETACACSDIFLKFCQEGLSAVRDGYKPHDHPDTLGLDTNVLKWRMQDDGLQWVSVSLSNVNAGSRNDMFSSYYVLAVSFPIDALTSDTVGDSTTI